MRWWPMARRSRSFTCMVIGGALTTWRNFVTRWTLRTRKCLSVIRRTPHRRILAMIEARDFFEAARQRRFDWYAGVPCSYLTPFINYVLQDPSLRYLSMANEGDAVALIAGVALAGGVGPPAVSCAASLHGRGVSMMQNSGLGNAVSPLTSLTW